MNFDLPVLPDTLTARPATEDDVPAMLELVRTYQTEVSGSSEVTEESLAAAFTNERRRSDNAVVVLEKEGAIVGRLSATRDGQWWYGSTTVAMRVPAEVREAALDAGMAWVEQTATANSAGHRQVRVAYWCPEQDTFVAGCLQRAGYEMVRSFIEMRMELAGRTEAAVAPEVTMRQADLTDSHGADVRTVYDLITESFRDHFDYKDRSFDEWVERRLDGPHLDTHGWFIAELDGRPAGATMHTHEFAEQNADYITNLGTLRWARGRGVAKAMLEHSFRRATARGRDAVILHVDAESPTGATALYDSVGMRRGQVEQQWQRWLDVDYGSAEPAS